MSLTGTADFFGTDFELVVGFSIDFPVGAGDGLLEVWGLIASLGLSLGNRTPLIRRSLYYRWKSS